MPFALANSLIAVQFFYPEELSLASDKIKYFSKVSIHEIVGDEMTMIIQVPTMKI